MGTRVGGSVRARENAARAGCRRYRSADASTCLAELCVAGRGLWRVRGQELGHQRQALATTDAVAVQPVHAADRAATPAGRGLAAGGFPQAVADADDHDDPARGGPPASSACAPRPSKGVTPYWKCKNSRLKYFVTAAAMTCVDRAVHLAP